MIDVPNPRTWVDGDMPPYSTLRTELSDSVNFLLNPPKVRLFQTVSRSYTSSVWTAVTWDDGDDPFDFWASGSRITPSVPGWYKCYMGMTWNALNTTADITGDRWLAIRRNGSTTASLVHNHRVAWATGYYVNLRGLRFHLRMNGTSDYIEMFTWQASGSTMTSSVLAALRPTLFMRWVAKY